VPALACLIGAAIGAGCGDGATDESASAGGPIELTEIGSFEAPLYVAQPPGSDDLYVVEQGDRILRLAPGGSTSPFLDVSGEITVGGEQGLLSVAFPPDFESSGLLYVDYTDTAGDTRIVEYRSPDGGASADPGSARELLRIPQPFSNHNGGQLEFDSDGLLYIGMGDGGGFGDPDRNAQDLGSLLGKILRIDPRPEGGKSGMSGMPYAIPPGNPFADTPGARPEIFSFGLRNPWRFSFDRETGALAIGDVGQDSREEVDLTVAGRASGANFGWSAFEGDERFNEDQQAPDAIPPVLTYANDGEDCSVTGGYVARDPDLPSLEGRYVYGDFCAGELRSFTARPGSPANDDASLGLRVENLSSFGEDRAGHLYATSLNGPVYRLDRGD
jgi:glucose/arabinose dehydrogenase